MVMLKTMRKFVSNMRRAASGIKESVFYKELGEIRKEMSANVSSLSSNTLNANTAVNRALLGTLAIGTSGFAILYWRMGNMGDTMEGKLERRMDGVKARVDRLEDKLERKIDDMKKLLNEMALQLAKLTK